MYFSFFLIITSYIINVNAKTRCVRAVGKVTCPTDKYMAANVEVKLLDRDCESFLNAAD